MKSDATKIEGKLNALVKLRRLEITDDINEPEREGRKLQ